MNKFSEIMKRAFSMQGLLVMAASAGTVAGALALSGRSVSLKPVLIGAPVGFVASEVAGAIASRNVT